MAEIILQFPPACLRTLKEHPRIRDIASGRASGRALRCSYFDSADGALRRDGITIRVARSGGRYQQFVMRDGTVVFSGPAEGEAPALESIQDPALRERVTGDNGELVTAFRHEARILRRPVRLDGALDGTIEIEDGTLSGGAAKRSYGVLRIRVADEEVGAAYAFASELADQVPLRLAVRPPAEIGFEMAAEAKPEPAKADKRPLPEDATVEDALVHIVRSCLDHLVANEASTLESEDPEGVHQMRVALRRMRSGFRLYRHMIPADQYDGIVQELKWITSRLGPTRDLDVFLDEILAPVTQGFDEETSLALLEAVCRCSRDEARAATREAVASHRYGRFVLDLHRWLERRAWREQPLNEAAATLFRPVAEMGSEALQRSYRKVRKRARRFAELGAAERHRLRIDVKRLRYALDFFGSLYRPKPVREFTERLAKLQDDLGYANDVAVARGLLEQLQTRASDAEAAAVKYGGALVLGWHHHALVGLQERVGTDIEAFLAEKTFWPKPQRHAP